jgi:hypothetical protein
MAPQVTNALSSHPAHLNSSREVVAVFNVSDLCSEKARMLQKVIAFDTMKRTNTPQLLPNESSCSSHASIVATGDLPDN